MSEKSNTFIFFGKSGSGTGTQAEFLIETLKEKRKEVIYIEISKQNSEYIEK